MKEQDSFIRFRGAERYVLDEELAKIVNVSMALEMPLLLKGEPGTGKTMLAHAIAENLGMPLIVLNVTSGEDQGFVSGRGNCRVYQTAATLYKSLGKMHPAQDAAGTAR